ncbi:ABC transporter ATP-binding protein [Cohnella pontilimi]|uniref:ABC transporter ATP-binding protein n=1 Tax=Cohnella pontilimi TaxID=2564100 RepID=A0A4U0FE59_9BACL|nr:ABC transporter ATP-binding protein [Cohnella pontilimi]TJY43080.1 ABC transporter ATP-binding protein [Cohnella pontilimi]
MAANADPVRDPLLLDGVSVAVTNEAGDLAALLDNVDLSLNPGEWLNVVGVNGSGKTTLARILAGLYVEGSAGSLSRGFAGESASPIVLQRPEAQLFGETPREEVLFALEWRQVPSHEIAGRTEETLRMTGLLELADVRWEGLSGGQRQLAAVAAAAACSAPLIVFDEAASMLDETNRAVVLGLARELHQQGTAIVWVTQRLDELMPGDRVIAMADGRVIYDGLVRAFFYGDEENPDGLTPCESCGLRLPYMSALALQWKRAGRWSGLLPVTQQEWREVWGNAERSHV